MILNNSFIHEMLYPNHIYKYSYYSCKLPVFSTQSIRLLFLYKVDTIRITSPCFHKKHPGVIYNNMGMFPTRTSPCFNRRTQARYTLYATIHIPKLSISLKSNYLLLG